MEVNENSEVPETEVSTVESTNLFDELKQLFDSQYPLFKLIYENETEFIALNITSNSTFEAVTFEHDFGLAEQFCSFDDVNTEVEIAADTNSIGTYSLEMTLTYGAETYTRTMQLTVLSLTPEVGTLTEELGKQQVIFILPGTSPI